MIDVALVEMFADVSPAAVSALLEVAADIIPQIPAVSEVHLALSGAAVVRPRWAPT